MKFVRLALAFALVPTFAHAHPGHGAEIGGIGWGLAHPFTGIDHILAMVAVGLWAVQLGRRALWLLPLCFVGAMTMGAALGMSGVTLPLVQPAIFASVLVLGALVAFAARLPLGASAALVSVAALFHGQAHGTEMAASGSGMMALLGLAMSTAALHAAGVSGGIGLARQQVLRFAGAAIVVAALAFGMR